MTEKRSVWSVSHGEYSEYGVTALYTTRQQAEYIAYIKNRQSISRWHYVEEFPLDPDDEDVTGPIPEMLEGWNVSVAASFHGGELRTPAEEPDDSREWRPRDAERVTRSTYGWYRAFVSLEEARGDYDRARKIAQDRVAEYRAREEGLT